MQGLIPPAYYRDPPHLAIEHLQIFQNTWSFVGLRFELAGLSHQGVRIGDKSIVVQCDKSGKPRAYLNVCSHRHAQLCDTGLHKGALRCPYHGWVYDREGVPTGIPQSQAFPEVVAEPTSFKLNEFACETAGEFIFVRISAEGPSLQEYLGNEYDFLVNASKGMAFTDDEFRKDVQANWKVVIENSLEGYHVPAVHNKTFMQVDGMQKGIHVPIDQLDHPLHSSMNHSAEPEWLTSFEKRAEPRIGKWAWKFPYYTHHFIFPNLTVTSFLGYSFHIQRFEPTATNLTTVHSRSIGVKFDNQNPVGQKMIEQIYADSKAFTERVFDEDGEICSRVQQGLENAINKALIGKGIESRVYHFHQAYTTALKSLSF